MMEPVPHGFNTDGGIHEIPLDATVGRLWLCGKHHIGPDVEAVRARHDIHTVVCLVEEHELAGRYDDYIEWLRAHEGRGALWYPIHDLTYPDIDIAGPFVDTVTGIVRDTGNVLVHCAAGIGRAGTTAVAVLMNLGMWIDDAVAHVRMHRPMAGPETGMQTEFAMQLQERIDSGA